MQQSRSNFFVWLGSGIAALIAVLLVLDYTGSGLISVGAIAQVSSLRLLNVFDAVRGKPTQAVEVDNVPQFQGCEKNEDGSANCSFED